jgi:hypothetical protein
MKQIYFHGQQSTFTIDGKTYPAKIGEMEIEFFPKNENIVVNDPVLLENSRLTFGYQDINFSATFELNDSFRQFLTPRPIFRQITIQIKGFIKEETKRTMYELQDQGYFFFLQFRQRIYPDLIHEISFLTMLELKN